MQTVSVISHHNAIAQHVPSLRKTRKIDVRKRPLEHIPFATVRTNTVVSKTITTAHGAIKPILTGTLNWKKPRDHYDHVRSPLHCIKSAENLHVS